MFYRWSPAEDTIINIAQYKILLDLHGVPLQVNRELDIAHATSPFGLYLGTVEQSTASDIACWTLAVAVVKLEHISYKIVFIIGDLETSVEVQPKTWLEAPLYNPDEIPKPPMKFTSPPPLIELEGID